MANLFDTYILGVKRQIAESMRDVMASYPDDRFRGKYIGYEYPMENEIYPAVYITYSEGPIQNVGVGHIDRGTDNNNNEVEVKHFKFQGRVNFNILGRTPIERDQLASVILNMIMFGDEMPEYEGFFAKLMGAKFLQIHLMPDMIYPGGEQVGPAPWQNANDLIYGRQYSVDVMGEFIGIPTTGDLIAINDVELYPSVAAKDLKPWW